MSIFNQQVDEGDSGSVEAVFEVVLAPAVSETVTVDYATVNGTAFTGQDFIGLDDTLTFAPGETSKQIIVLVNGDVFDETPSEQFTVELTNPTNAIIIDGIATGLIRDDDEGGEEPTEPPVEEDFLIYLPLAMRE